MESKQLALRCRELADNKKAENIVILDLSKLASVTDYMVICSATSDPHLRAIEEEISGTLVKQDNIRPHAVDGTRHSGWIILDYVDVLVHVMKPETREFYDLEGLWNDAPRVRATKPKAAKAPKAPKTPKAPAAPKAPKAPTASRKRAKAE